MGKKDRYRIPLQLADQATETTQELSVAVSDQVERRLPRQARNALRGSQHRNTSFRAWFTGKTAENSLDRRLARKGGRYDEILAYFRSVGLTETEPASSYEQTIKVYFGE